MSTEPQKASITLAPKSVATIGAGMPRRCSKSARINGVLERYEVAFKSREPAILDLFFEIDLRILDTASISFDEGGLWIHRWIIKQIGPGGSGMSGGYTVLASKISMLSDADVMVLEEIISRRMHRPI